MCISQHRQLSFSFFKKSHLQEFNTLLISIDRSSKQKVNKERVALSDPLDQENLIDIFKAFHPEVAEYKLFSRVHGTLSRIDMGGHKTK